MDGSRHLDWDGCFNVRDLGGLRTIDGRRTRWGAVVRSDSVNFLTSAGWSAAQAHGIRTVVDLRDDHEVRADRAPRPDGITTVRVPIDDSTDIAMWQHFRDTGLDVSPLYYRPFLERKSELCAAAITAIARAEPGGVVVHCALGRDRTGLVTLLLLAIAGVKPEEIAADYDLSTERLPAYWASSSEDDQTLQIQEFLRRKNTTARAAMLATLEGIDIADHLRSAGLTDDDLAALRARMLGQNS